MVHSHTMIEQFSESNIRKLSMESFGLSLAYFLCTILSIVILWRNLPLAWKLFRSPHWMVRNMVLFMRKRVSPARLNSGASERTDHFQLRTCPLPLFVRSIPTKNTVSTSILKKTFTFILISIISVFCVPYSRKLISLQGF